MKKQIEKEDDRRKRKEERIEIEQLNMMVQISYHTTFCTTIYDIGSSEFSVLPHCDHQLRRIKRTDFMPNRTEPDIFSDIMGRPESNMHDEIQIIGEEPFCSTGNCRSKIAVIHAE